MRETRQIMVPELSWPEPEEYSSLTETVAKRKIFYRLGESELFTYANRNTMVGGQKIIDIIPRMVVNDQGFMEVNYDQIDKTAQYELFEGPRYKLSCKKSLKNLIDSGRIRMVYSETYKLPTSIPYIIQGTGSQCRVYVNVSDFLQLDQYGKYQITSPRNYNALMAIIFAGAVAVRLMETSNPVPADFGDGLTLLYGSMLERVINSIAHMDPVTKDKIRYLATEYALVQMYGTEDGQTMFFSRYKQKYFPKLSKMITETIDAQFNADSFDKLSIFCIELARVYPSLRGIDDYKLMDKWIRLYGPATAMSIDYLGYHIYTVSMVFFESPLISRMALEPILEQNRGVDMYRRMQMIIGE